MIPISQTQYLHLLAVSEGLEQAKRIYSAFSVAETVLPLLHTCLHLATNGRAIRNKDAESGHRSFIKSEVLLKFIFCLIPVLAAPATLCGWWGCIQRIWLIFGCFQFQLFLWLHLVFERTKLLSDITFCVFWLFKTVFIVEVLVLISAVHVPAHLRSFHLSHWFYLVLKNNCLVVYCVKHFTLPSEKYTVVHCHLLGLCGLIIKVTEFRGRLSK